MEETTAIFVKEKFRSDGGEGDFIIGVARSEDNGRLEFAVLGDSPPRQHAGDDPNWHLTPQLSYRFFGHWDNHKQWGRQFKFKSFVVTRPHSEAAVVRYLCEAGKGCGLGPQKARRLWTTYKADAVRMLRESPDVAAAVASVKPEQAAEIAAKLRELEAVEDTLMELEDLLKGRGFPKATAKAAVRAWGNRAPLIIQRDCYALMRFRGAGFLRCDAMYLDLGLPPARMKRQVCSLWYGIASDNHGHTWISEYEAFSHLRKTIAGAEVDAEKALAIGVRHGALMTRRDCEHCGGTGELQVRDHFGGDTFVLAPCHRCYGNGGRRWVAESRKAKAESYVAGKVVDMLGWSRHWPEVTGPAFERLTDHQREELAKALAGPVGILAGSPGTGKTFSTAALIRALIAAHGENSIAIAAPTGKAARRCTEAMQEYGIKIEAKTIHRTLVVEQADDDSGQWSFLHGERKPLPFRFLVLDECSMIGCGLMASVLKAVARGTNVLFVGDRNQLLPVEHGAPLRDLLPHLPTGELTEIHRNAGTIVRACAAIRDERPIPLDKIIQLEPPHQFITGSDPHDHIEGRCYICDGGLKVCKVCGQAEGELQPHCSPRNLQLIEAAKDAAPAALLKLVEEIRDAGRFDPIADVQVIVAVNDKSPLSRKKLNPQLQAMLNPVGRGPADSEFKSGDKCVITKNNFYRDAKLGGEVKHFVANGEFGRVVEVRDTQLVLKFENPTRLITAPRTGGDVELGYAATAWKMQGSSAPCVILLIDPYPGATGSHGNCDRSFCYTGLSRAETVCYVVGELDRLKSVCRRQFIMKRKTFLSQLVEKCRTQ